jgi:hypothetical protein
VRKGRRGVTFAENSRVGRKMTERMIGKKITGRKRWAIER